MNLGVQNLMKRTMLNVALSAAFVLAVRPRFAQSEVATKAAAALEPYKKLPEFQAAGEPFDAKACMADKSIIAYRRRARFRSSRRSTTR